MTCGFLINTLQSASQLYKICFIIWYVFSAVHIMLLPSRKPSSSYSLLKFVYVTSQLRHSLVVHPLLRKILDPPLLKSFSTLVTMIVDIDLSPISRLITSMVGLFLAPLALKMSSPFFFSQGFEINWNTGVREHLPSAGNLPRRCRRFDAPLAYLVSSTIPKENEGLPLTLGLISLIVAMIWKQVVNVLVPNVDWSGT